MSGPVLATPGSEPRQALAPATKVSATRQPERKNFTRAKCGKLRVDAILVCPARRIAATDPTEPSHPIAEPFRAIANQEKIDIIESRLIKNFGYNEVSATDVLNYVASIFARGDAKE